jgi:LPS export ABC transporter protein LptC
LKQKHPIKKCQRLLLRLVAMVAAVFLMVSCKEKNENLVAFSYDPELVPSLVTDEGFQLVSDSGITRYKMVYDVWMVFDKAKEPYWFFPEGLYVEQFTPDFEIESIVEADTAWFYVDKDLLRLKKNVHVENLRGDVFDSDELFWDRKKARVYSNAYIEVQQGGARLSGYGFESNQQMTDFRIFRPHDGRLPLVEQPDSARVDSTDTELPLLTGSQAVFSPAIPDTTGSVGVDSVEAARAETTGSARADSVTLERTGFVNPTESKIETEGE